MRALGIALFCSRRFLCHNGAVTHFRQGNNIGVGFFLCSPWVTQAGELILNRQCFGQD
jgi:hypothetical protein